MKIPPVFVNTRITLPFQMATETRSILSHKDDEYPVKEEKELISGLKKGKFDLKELNLKNEIFISDGVLNCKEENSVQPSPMKNTPFKYPDMTSEIKIEDVISERDQFFKESSEHGKDSLVNCFENFEVTKEQCESQKQFACSICHKVFYIKRNLNRHLVIHSTDLYRCSKCSYVTNKKESIKVHESNHLETKQFNCSLCEYGTNAKRYLRQHVLTHERTKRFSCDHCSYQTNFRGKLRDHETTHLEIKCFRCSHCSYTTNRRDSLRKHEVRHTEDKRFKCEVCGYGTDFNFRMTRHIQTHLNKTVENPSD